jgi:hypothetical protein
MRWRSADSTAVYSSANDYESSMSIASSNSSNNFDHSARILTLLATHPDFVRVPHDQQEFVSKAIAFVVSTTLFAGGVYVIVVTWGAATPGQVLLIGTLMSAGSAGLTAATQPDFTWSNYAFRVGTSVTLSLITFGAGYGAGSCVGWAFQSSGLSEATIQTLACFAGGLSGAVIRSGTYYVIMRIAGQRVTTVQLLVEGALGALTGAQAGLLGVQGYPVSSVESPPDGTGPEIPPSPQSPPQIVEDAFARIGEHNAVSSTRGALRFPENCCVSLVTSSDGTQFIASSGPKAFISGSSSSLAIGTPPDALVNLNQATGIDFGAIGLITQRTPLNATELSFRPFINCAEPRALELALQSGVRMADVVEISAYRMVNGTISQINYCLNCDCWIGQELPGVLCSGLGKN